MPTRQGSRRAGSTHLQGYAWVLLLIAVGLIYALPMMQFTLPEPVTYILYGVAGLSVLVAFLYNSPGKNPFFNIGAGSVEERTRQLRVFSGTPVSLYPDSSPSV